MGDSHSSPSQISLQWNRIPLSYCTKNRNTPMTGWSTIPILVACTEVKSDDIIFNRTYRIVDYITFFYFIFCLLIPSHLDYTSLNVILHDWLFILFLRILPRTKTPIGQTWLKKKNLFIFVYLTYKLTSSPNLGLTIK